MIRSSLEIYSLTTGRTRVVLQTDQTIEAPNWHPSGWLMVNGMGRLYRVPLTAPSLIPIDTGTLTRCNNDHGFTRDGAAIIFSCHRDHGAEIFRLTTGSAELISPEPPSWFHGTSPDGRAMTYAADGKSVYYNSDRSGHAQIWVMNADGTNQRPLFSDQNVNWFPHPSPDGQRLLYLAYPPGTLGHPRDLQVALCLCDPDGQNRRRLVEMTGGQGTINVPSWSPDSMEFAFMRFVPQP